MIDVLIGEDAFLVRRALDKLLATLLPREAREFNFDIFEGKEVEASRVLERANTFPVFSERRLILIRQAHEMKKVEAEGVVKGLDQAAPTTDWIFVAAQRDRRLTFWQELEKKGRLHEIKPPAAYELPRWIIEEAKSAAYLVLPEAASWLASALGADMGLIASTLEKLYLLKGKDKTIRLEDVESCVTSFSWKSVFELTDAVGRRKLSKALPLFQKMMVSGESAVALLALLARHFRLLSRVKEGETSGIPPYFIQDYKKQAEAFSIKELAQKREKIFETDWALKSLPIPSSILFEKLMMNLCGNLSDVA